MRLFLLKFLFNSFSELSGQFKTKPAFCDSELSAVVFGFMETPLVKADLGKGSDALEPK